MLSRWLDSTHHAQRKPWSWVAQTPGRELLIGLLDDRLAELLCSGAGATGAAVRQVAAASWSELRNGQSRDAWCLEFISPVTFRRGNRFLPWPSPSAVFGSLRSSWRSFGAPVVGDLELDLQFDPLVVTALCGASRTERVTVHKQESVLVGGFVGTVRYTLDGAADPQVIDTLVRLAPFSGVGAYTTRGFGGVRLLGE
ncbi:MAG TPA: CRISPR-associated endoribonuclease Cas6 [Pseudonocardiaceae bacterium]|jgi:CRISPR-associated endoribonuclease Cas6|nr:CRISPR-associated endoribonuclease Cas6 [Pseudonocardiaceae bacterium]